MALRIGGIGDLCGVIDWRVRGKVAIEAPEKNNTARLNKSATAAGADPSPSLRSGFGMTHLTTNY
jgi:hypothetical protein